MIDFDARAATWDDDPKKVERAQTVAALIAAEVSGLSARRVLEYGSGTGLLGFALRPRVAAVTLADTSAGMLAQATRKIAASGYQGMSAVRLDLSTDPLPAERYDLVCSLMTLHHVPDTAGLLRALRRLLAPGGVACLADLDTEDGSFHGAGVEVHHGFDRGLLGKALEAAGFLAPSFQTAFEIEKAGESGLRRYPVFLATARLD